MSNDRFTRKDKKGPGGTPGYSWTDKKSGDRGHTGFKKDKSGTRDYHEKNHKTGGILGWTFNPSDSSKNKNTGNPQGRKESGRG